MGIQSQSALIAAILLLALALNVALQDRRVEHRWSFVGLLAALFFYNIAIFLHQVTDGGFWTRVAMVAGVGVAQGSRRFFDEYLTPASWSSRLPVRTLVDGGSVAIVVLAMTQLGTSAFLGVCAAGLALFAYGQGVWRLYQRYLRAEVRAEERRLSYLVLGGAISVVLSAVDLLAASGTPLPAVGHLFTTVYMYFWMQVVQRSRLLDLRELLGRGLALLVQSVAMSAVYFTLLVWAADQTGLFFFNIVLASVVLFFTFEPLKRLVDVWIGRLLFHDTFELEHQLSLLRRELAHVISLGDLADRVLSRLQASRRVTHASVFLLDEGGKSYSAPRSVGPVECMRFSVVQGRAFLDALQRERVVSLEQVEQRLRDLEEGPAEPAEKERLRSIQQTMELMSAGLSFAVIARDRLVAFLNVLDGRTREAFSSNEIALIAGLTAQITTVVENSELVQRLKERDRLQVMGEMAAGMAHEIRNPLGAIKAAGQLLDPASLDEEQREFVEVIIEESDRLDAVLSQFLDYARPYRGKLEPVDLGPVLERVVMLLKADAPGVTVVVDRGERTGPEGLPTVAGDADQILQVLLNLTRNAVDAMEGKGRLVLRAEKVGDGVEVQVTDSGPGIPPEAREHLFVPFFTTKRKGTGLGLAICQRILQHHQAEIRVDTEVGRGTTMSFRLRRADGHAGTGEHRRRLDVEAS
jgi:two-component system sensor histidine kinase HydH